MATTDETPFVLADGKEAYMKKWIPSSKTIAKLVFVHGYSDHVNRYFELFPTLAGRGIEVVAWDQRGWGRTFKNNAEKGATGPTTQVLADVAHVIKAQLPCAVPLFLMGHSMGGGEVLTFACTPEYDELIGKLRGFLLESPLIYFAPGKEPNFLAIMGGRLAGRLMPKMQLVNVLPPEDLTRDPVVVQSLKDDKLCHNTGTLEGLSGMIDRTIGLHDGKLKLRKGVHSLWLAHGTIDGGTSYAASKKWFADHTASVADKTFKSYEGWQHQLHADLPETRPIFAKDVGDWIVAKSGTVGESKL